MTSLPSRSATADNYSTYSVGDRQQAPDDTVADTDDVRIDGERKPSAIASTNRAFCDPQIVTGKRLREIVSLHLKDRTADGGNLPWGQGKTPIREILQLMQKEKWTFPADIELEYKVPEGSDSVAEVAKCVQYCKESLA